MLRKCAEQFMFDIQEITDHRLAPKVKDKHINVCGACAGWYSLLYHIPITSLMAAGKTEKYRFLRSSEKWHSALRKASIITLIFKAA